MTTLRRCAVSLSALGLLALVPAVADAKTVTVRSSGLTASLKIGDRLVVSVAENPSTGYGWKTTARPSFLRQLSSTYKATPVDPGVVGGGGRRIITFKATKKGSGSLKLVYRRSFAPDAGDTRFTVRVTVR
ncbi:MAG: uncharacterized protein JWM31_1598 [Solirubrobacterales bacterium]|nr:uncharacterized protein [Solirubrobacterales bacterium]